MLPTDLLRKLVSTLEQLRLDYFITGSVASSRYGEYRLTHDIDVVVELPSWKVGQLCEHFAEPDYYVSVEAAMEAARQASQFNIIHTATALKVDVMVMDDRPFNESRRSRARRLELAPGLPAMVSAPEDVILMKLVFHREGGSDKHLRDIASMIRISGDQIDRAYIDHWAPILGVADEWGVMKRRLETA